MARLRETLARDGHLAGRDLATWTRHLALAADAIAVALARLRETARERPKQEGRQLEAEQAELERGRQRYPDGAEALLHLLRARLRGAREPRPLVRADRGALGALARRGGGLPQHAPLRRASWPPRTSRAPSASTSATSATTRCPGAGAVFIASVGLVDIERIQAMAPRREPRSLAEQVTTDDALARAYVDFLLGDVICCESEQELRRHRRAITDTVMVYQNHVARQTPPEVFRRHYIGEAARARRREEIGRRLAELSQAFVDLGPGDPVAARPPPRRAGRRRPRPSSCPAWSRRRSACPTSAPAPRSSSASSTASTARRWSSSSASARPPTAEAARLDGERAQLLQQRRRCERELEHLGERARPRVLTPSRTRGTARARSSQAASSGAPPDAERRDAYEERYRRERDEPERRRDPRGVRAPAPQHRQPRAGPRAHPGQAQDRVRQRLRAGRRGGGRGVRASSPPSASCGATAACPSTASASCGPRKRPSSSSPRTSSSGCARTWWTCAGRSTS